MEHRTTGVPRRMPCSGFPWPAFLLAVACLPLHLPRTVTSFRTNAQGLASILHSLLLSPSLLTTYHLPLLPSILAAAFPFAICVLHFYTVFISCDALGGYASPSLSWPFFSSLSPVPSLSLSLSPSLSFSLPLSFSLSLSFSLPFSAPLNHSLYTWYLLSMPCNRRLTCHCPASAPRLTSCCSASLHPPGPHLRQTALVLPTCVHRLAVQVVPLGRRGTHHATKGHRRKYRSSCNLHLLVLACCSF